MPKCFLIFIQLILILKIVFSTQWIAIEMEDLKSKSTQNVEINNFFPPIHLGNTNVMTIQSKFTINNFLIYLSSDKFKYCILPYLSSHNFLKIYLHFQNLVPELNFEKFLPPLRFYTTNNVLDMQEPTTYLQPLQINLLYQFNGEFSSLESHILYSSKNKIPIIVETHNITILPDSICAHLSHNKVISYETYVIPSSHQGLLILRDVNHFFVTFEKSQNEFINIAKCSRVSEKEFPDYVECIWEAYNLQGWIKYYWKLKSFLTTPYEKYLFYLLKIISCLGSRLIHFSKIFTEYLFRCDYSCAHIFACLFSLNILSIFAMAFYTIFFLWYYATMLPFYILSIPFKHFFFGFNWYSMVLVSPSLASLYVCLFPNIKNSMPFSIRVIEHIQLEDILPSVVKCFEIKPKKIMSIVPLLVQKRKKIFGRVCRYFYVV